MQSFKALLDSGTTHHIINNHTLFQSYDESKAIPIKTTNCGILNTFAMGQVHSIRNSVVRQPTWFYENASTHQTLPSTWSLLGQCQRTGCMWDSGKTRLLVTFLGTTRHWAAYPSRLMSSADSPSSIVNLSKLLLQTMIQKPLLSRCSQPSKNQNTTHTCGTAGPDILARTQWNT